MGSLDLFSLAGKVAIVTGGSRGLGRAIALGYAEAGADVVVTSRTLADVEKVAQEIRERGRKALAFATDVTKADQVQNMVDRTMEAFGKIDILVNNAGISSIYERVDTTKEEDWDFIFDINVKGTFLCSKAVGKVMIEQRQGRIINLGSVVSAVGFEKISAYAATKGAVLQFTRAMALDWAKYNILVNAIAPAFAETEMTAGMRGSPRHMALMTDPCPLKRLARPEEVVGPAIMLASAAGSYMTGTIVFIDGGWTAA